jgi:Rrf2 family transcriptional regulator, cysteine metabolism repressor
MFRVTRAEEQGVRLTMRLATTMEQMTLGELSEAESLPEPTVAKLLGMLRRGGVVEAVRGRNGGYILGGTPDNISTAMVLAAITGNPAFGYPCQKPNPNEETACPRTGDCGLRPVWQHLESRVLDILQETTIADLLKKESNAARDLNHLWPLSEDGLPAED